MGAVRRLGVNPFDQPDVEGEAARGAELGAGRGPLPTLTPATCCGLPGRWTFRDHLAYVRPPLT